MIPPFNTLGNLPTGIYPSSWNEFVTRFGTNEHRKQLLSGLINATQILKKAGCVLIYVDGSFVTDKKFPNDYDACWDIHGVNPNSLDQLMLQFDDKSRALLKMKYFGDLFPAQLPEGKSGKAFIDFFQSDKFTGEMKGIVALKPKTL